jgi:hypothetical protein
MLKCNKCGKVIRCCEEYCPCGGEYVDERDIKRCEIGPKN